MSDGIERTGRARRAAELALVRVCNHYGERPNFVLLGGLVPALLCSDSDRLHAGTTDVDVQVDLEISGGADHARQLEIALKNADFRVDSEQIWRWETVQGGGYKAVIKFELLADLDDQPQGANIHFNNTQKLGAINLRGTGYASKDYTPTSLVAYDQGARITAEVNVTGLAGFLLAKTAAAYGRHKAKDYYDIAFCCCTTTRSLTTRDHLIRATSCSNGSVLPSSSGRPSRTSRPTSPMTGHKASRHTSNNSSSTTPDSIRPRRRRMPNSRLPPSRRPC